MHRKFISSILFMLVLAFSAFAQTTPAISQPGPAKQVYVKSVVYSAPPTLELLPATELVTASPLDGGKMKTTDFERAFSQLVSAGKITVGSRPAGKVEAGKTLELTAGSNPRLSRFKFSADEIGDDGKTFDLQIELESWHDNYHTVVSTSIYLRAGETIIFSTGTSPDNRRKNFYALSIETDSVGSVKSTLDTVPMGKLLTVGTAEFARNLAQLVSAGKVTVRNRPIGKADSTK